MILTLLAQRVAILAAQAPLSTGQPAPTPEPPVFDTTLATVPFDWRTAILPTIAALATVALLIWAARWFRRRFGNKPTVAPTIPPASLALGRLDELEGENPYGKGDVRRHFYLVSEIARNFVEGRYGIPAMERTTFEVERDLKQRSELTLLRDQLLPLLKLCDQVKFSTDGEATPDEATAVIAMARRVVALGGDREEGA